MTSLKTIGASRTDTLLVYVHHQDNNARDQIRENKHIGGYVPAHAWVAQEVMLSETTAPTAQIVIFLYDFTVDWSITITFHINPSTRKEE